MDQPNDNLEPLLRTYLAANLDPQLGRAAAHFAAAVPDQFGPTPATRPTPRRGRLIAAVAASAASIAGAVWCGMQISGPATEVADPVTLPVKGPVDEGGSPRPDQAQPVLAVGHEATPPAPVLVGEQLQWQTIDEGIVYLDPQTPVRKLRRQRFERLEWYDAARGAHVQMMVPREVVQFVALPSS